MGLSSGVARVVSAVLLFGMGLCVAIAADGKIRDPSGTLLLSIDGKTWRTTQGALLVTVEGSGHIRDRNGRTVLTLSRKGEVRDHQGRLMGQIDPSGNVRLVNGRLVGQINKDGFVRDANARLIGRGDAVNAQWLGLYFFFLNPRML